MVKPVVSAMIWRTSELRPAPPLITIMSLSTPCDAKRIHDICEAVGKPA